MNAAGKRPESIKGPADVPLLVSRCERQLRQQKRARRRTTDAGVSGRGHKCTCEVLTTSAVWPDGQLQVKRGEEEEGGRGKGRNQQPGPSRRNVYLPIPRRDAALASKTQMFCRQPGTLQHG